MRSIEEIIGRLTEIKQRDVFGVESATLIQYLPFRWAKLYNTAVSAEEWESQQPAMAKDAIIKEIKDYLPYAKSIPETETHEIDAFCALSHFSAWVWLLGDTLGANSLKQAIDRVYAVYGSATKTS